MFIDGRAIAQKIIDEIGTNLRGKKVCFILFGNDESSKQFIRIKTRIAEKFGMHVDCIQNNETIDTDTACRQVTDICNRGYDGVIVQLPLPAGLDTVRIVNTVPMHQDIDVLNTETYEVFKNADTLRVPPVAGAVWEIIKTLNMSLEHKNIVLIGYGNLVGKPVSDLLVREGVIHTIITKETDNALRETQLKQADIVISGVGVPHMITPDMIQPGCVLIDAGTSESSGVLVGDIHPDCIHVASHITPVPGGVGPVTVACVYKNLLA